jgi:hypothetical protein
LDFLLNLEVDYEVAYDPTPSFERDEAMDYILKNQMTLAEAQAEASANQVGKKFVDGHHASPTA